MGMFLLTIIFFGDYQATNEVEQLILGFIAWGSMPLAFIFLILGTEKTQLKEVQER